MAAIRLIAFDLDNTLLNADKELTPENAAALADAAAAGIELVPATGRFFSAVPEAVRRLPFLRYAITSNGAKVLDLRRGGPIAQALIAPAQAVEVMCYFDTLPNFLYEASIDDWGWMSRAFYDQLEAFAPDPHALKVLRDFRTPVEDLKALVLEKGHGVLKLQAFTWDMALRARLIEELPRRFPGIAVATSSRNNLDINDAHANKGEALAALADALGIPLAETLAFGDDLNDAGMLRAAGVGAAMANACPETKAAADFITLSCEESGVAAGIRRFL